MLGKEMLTTLYRYNSRANFRLLDCAAHITASEFDAPSDYSHGSLHQTLFHMLRNEWEWRHFCQYHLPPEPRQMIEQFQTVAVLRAHHEHEDQRFHDYLAHLTEDDLQEQETITWWNGKQHTRVLWHLLMDVFCHSSQHRSESAALLTHYGQSPGDLDFLFFVQDASFRK